MGRRLQRDGGPFYGTQKNAKLPDKICGGNQGIYLEADATAEWCIVVWSMILLFLLNSVPFFWRPLL